MNEKKKRIIKINIIAIIAIIILCIAITPKTLQEDTYYLIKVGEYIVKNGVDQSVEPFAFHEGLPYTYPHCLFSVLIYVIYTIGNFKGIYIMTVLFAISIGLILYFSTKKLYEKPLLSTILAIASMYLLTGFMTARAQMLGYIVFALEIYNVERLLKTGNKRNVVALVILALILANSYVATYPFFFILLLPYIAEYIISIINRKKYYEKRIEKLKLKVDLLKVKYKATQNDIYNKKIEKINNKVKKYDEKLSKTNKKTSKREYRKLEIENNKNVKLLILAAMMALFAGICTPLGDSPYTYLIKTLIGNTTLFIAEHQPLTLMQNIPLLVAIIASLGIIIFSDVKIKLREVFMLLGLSLLSLSAVRQISVLVIVGTYIMCRLISETLNRYQPKLVNKISEKIIKFPYVIYIILIVSILSAVLYKAIVAGTDYVDKTSYPVEATKWIKENIDIKNARIFNGFNYGSYLIFEGIPVFIDGRSDLYDPTFHGDTNPNDIFTDYMLSSSLQLDYEETFKKYEITHVMLVTSETLNLLIAKDENYKELYKDSHFVIYERNTGKDMEALKPEDSNYSEIYKNSDFAIYDMNQKSETNSNQPSYEADESGTVTIKYDENGNIIE